MNLKNKLKKIKSIFRGDSEEIEEEKEFEEFIKKIESRMNKISAAQKAQTHESRAQVALMFENAYIQKKLSEENTSLKSATWILAIATGALVYVTIIDSKNSPLIIQNLQGVVGILAFILAIGLVTGVLILLWKIIKILICKNNKK